MWKEGQQQQAAPVHQQQYGFNPNQQQTTRPASHQWTRVKEHRLHESSVNSIAWAPHEFGLSLACASSDGQISVITYCPEDSTWDVKAFPAHQIGCNAVSWCPSPSSDYLAALSSGQQKQEPLAKRLVSGGCDNLAKVWKFDESGASWKVEASLQGHTDWVRDVAWAPSGNLIASCSQDRSVLLWKLDGSTWTKQPLASEPFGDTVWSLSWSMAGNLLAVTCGDNTVSLWRETPSGTWERISKTDQSNLSQ